MRLGFLATIPFSQSSASARSWLLFGFFLPFPALVIYALIGRTGEPRVRLKRLVNWNVRRAKAIADLVPESADDAADHARAKAFGAYPAVPGNVVKLLADYDLAIERIVADIEVAQSRVVLTAYIFANDQAGSQIIEALCRAVRRGVVCHVLVDAIGSRRWGKDLATQLRRGGVTVAFSNRFLPWFGGTGRIDRRNHRKLYIIDDRIAYLGSQNLVARNFVSGVTNFELLARIEGPAAASATLAALGDWYVNTGEELDLPKAPNPVGDATVQIMPSGPDEPQLGFQSLLTSLLARAGKSITIASPYTVLDETMLQTLVTAATSGIKTTLIVSAVVDKPLVRLAQDCSMQPLLAAGVQVRAFKDGLLHAKYVIIDDRLGILGSSNSDVRSFRINSEIGMITVDPGTVLQLADIAADHLSACDPITLAEWEMRPRWRRPLERLAGLAAPLL